jgi:hypothetical protein
MDCAEFKEQVALFALGALDDATRAACHQHLQQAAHDGCVEALNDAMVATDSLSEAVQPPAPLHVWSAIDARLGASDPWRRRFAFAAAAAVLFAVVAGSAGALLRNERAQVTGLLADKAASERTLATKAQQLETCARAVDDANAAAAMQRDAVALLQLPGTTLFPLKSEKGERATANVIIHTGLKRAYVVANGLKAAPQGDYEMWVAKGKRVVAAGLMKVGADGNAVLRVDYAALLGDIGAPDAMMVTLEPAGGSETVRGPTIMFGVAG